MQISNLFEKLGGHLELKITQQSEGLFDVGMYRDGVKTELSAAGVPGGELGGVVDELQELARQVPGLARGRAGSAAVLWRAKLANAEAKARRSDWMRKVAFFG